MTSLACYRRRVRLLGDARLRLALLVAALAATFLTLLTALPAHAEPTPQATPAPSAPPAAGQRAPTAEEQAQIEDFLREQSEKLSPFAQEKKLNEQTEQLRKMLPDEGGVLSVFNVTDANGLPISAYTVKSDTGAIIDWDLGIENLLTELTFMAVKWLIAFACWLIAWALSFGLAKILLVPVTAVADSLHSRVILEMGLPSLFLAVCAVICTARIFFGDKARGWGDAALSILLAALATTLLSAPPQTLMGENTGAIAVARGFSLEVADVILDANPASPQTAQAPGETTPAGLARPLTDALTDAFIVKPAMLLQYGRTFSGTCAQAYSDTKISQLAYDRQITARTSKIKKLTGLADYLSPAGLPISSFYDAQLDMTNQWVADHFGNPPMEAFEAKCVTGDVDAAKKASPDKLGGSLFLLLAALIVTVLIAKLAGSFLIAQARIAWDAARGESALIVGTIPGAGRAYLWDWGASVLRSLGQMLWSVIALAVFIVIVQAVLNPVQDQWGRELTLRFVIVDILCIGAFVKRKQITTRSQQIAGNLRSKMNGARVGGTHGSAFSPPASQTIPKQRHIARSAARGLIRGAVIGASLATGNPLTAAAYAMPSGLGATTLLARINTGRPGSQGRPRPPARPAGRPRPTTTVPHRPPSTTTTTPPTAPPRPVHPPRPGPPPRPTHRPGSHSARRPAPATQRPASPRTHTVPAPPPPAASTRQQQLRQRLARSSHRTPPRRTP